MLLFVYQCRNTQKYYSFCDMDDMTAVYCDDINNAMLFHINENIFWGDTPDSVRRSVVSRCNAVAVKVVPLS